MATKRTQKSSSAPRGAKAVSAEIKEARDILNFQYQFCRPYFDRANEDNRMYDQIIDPASWTTMSEMTLGLAYRLVQNTLPNLLFNVLWAAEYPFNLIPEDLGDMTPEDAMKLSEKMREYLLYQLRNRMRIDEKGYSTIIDGVKVGCGYGIIEPQSIQTVERATLSVRDATTGQTAKRKILQMAKNRTQIGYRYLPFGSVLPTPDGATPDEAMAVSVVDFIDEYTLRGMLAKDEDGNESEFTFNADEVIEYAKKNQFDASTQSIRSVIARLCGFNGDHYPVMSASRRQCEGIGLIPVVKQFRKDKHTWIACDNFVIYKTEKTPQTLQCPVVKYTFSPEGGNWFTRGVINPNRDLMRSTETWYNAMLDLFSLHLHPHQVVNVDAMSEEEAIEDMAPYAKTYVRGEPSRSQAFVTPPPLPSSVSGIGDRLSQISDENAGLGVTSGLSGAGMTRGGAQALESVLQSSTMREKMLAKHLENTWYAPVIKLTLVYSSIYAEEDDNIVLFANEADKAKKSGKPVGKRFEAVKITTDDLAHLFRVEIDFRDKIRNFLVESAHRLQVYDRLVKDPSVGTEELKRYLVGDDAIVRRLIAGVDRDERLREISEQARALNPQPPQLGAPAGAPPPESPLAATAAGGSQAGGGSGLASILTGEGGPPL